MKWERNQTTNPKWQPECGMESLAFFRKKLENRTLIVREGSEIRSSASSKLLQDNSPFDQKGKGTVHELSSH